MAESQKMALDKASQTLGQELILQLISQLSNIDGRIGMLQGQMAIVISESERAAEIRRQMSDKLNRIEAHESTLERIVPLVDRHESSSNKAAGIIHLGHGFLTLMAAGIGALISFFMQWLSKNPIPH